jgi:hypothetical protein
MSAAFVIAILCFIATVCGSLLMVFGGSMSDNPSQSEDMRGDTIKFFIGGTVVSLLIAATHYAYFTW